MGGGADGGGIDFGSDKEGDGIGTKLGEEGGEEVHRLEGFDARERLVIGEVEGGYEEENEDHEEADQLHFLAAVELIVDEEGSEIVTYQRDAHIDQVVKPAFHHRGLVRGDDFDKFGLEEFVAVCFKMSFFSLGIEERET